MKRNSKAATVGGSVVEPSTNTPFPRELTIDLHATSTPISSSSSSSSSSASPSSITTSLGTVGVRTKWMVSVYAFGLYFDFENQALLTALRTRWRTHAGAIRSGKGTPTTLFDDLLRPNVDKVLRLVMVRGIKGDDLKEAFEQSIPPRLAIISASKKERGKKAAGVHEAFKQFKQHFSKKNLVKGTEVTFLWSSNTQELRTLIDGKEVGKIGSNGYDICWALFDLYLGDNPISENAKSEFIKFLDHLLKQHISSKL
eukprot:TRINITY_DN6268_c0_g1_i1.p1 TRINITY_DN6268_c0_g1~~TRINITY_DN6268_c0_g1_i1.p1  ORF type:complete len:281 (+),score=65.88 TRINITY_DN6268_c0_g1_i1:77-844(+)